MTEYSWMVNYAATFRAVHFGHCCGGEVSVNHIQKEVSWVVVGLAGIALNTNHNDAAQYQSKSYTYSDPAAFLEAAHPSTFIYFIN